MTGPVFNAGAIEATARIDRDQFTRDIRAMQAEMKKLAGQSVKVPVTFDRSKLKTEAAEARKVVAGLPPAKLGLGLNTQQARRDASDFKIYIKGLAPAKLSLGAVWQQGRSDVADFKRYVRNLAATKLTVGADTSSARRSVDDLRRVAGIRDININVDADVLEALSKMRLVDRERSRLNGSNATVNIGADATRALGWIGLVTAGLSSIAYLAPIAGAALAGVAVGGGVLAQTAGSIGAGFFGISGAIKAVTAEENKIPTETSSNTSTIKSALRAREDAYRQVGRVAAQSNEQLEDAYRSVTRVGIQSRQQLEDAEKQLARAIDNASEQISEAERGEARASRTLTEAQNDLTKAKKEAIQTNEDLKDSLDDAVISEEEALLDLQDATRNLENAKLAGITGEPLQRIDIAQRKAAEAYDQAQKSTKRLATENEEAAKKGVEGNDQVVAAKERVVSANEAEQDAVRRLQEAHEDADVAILDAETNLYRTQQQNRDAQEDAERNLSRARIEASQAQEDAARNVIEAQERVNDALQQTGTAADTAAKKAEQALAKLTPEGRKFVHFLLDEARPALKEISDSAQAALLPHVGDALRRLLELQPMVRAGTAETATVVGRLADEGARMVTSGPWKRDFQTILSSHNRILTDLGISTLNVADATRSMYAEALPTIELFAKWLNTSTALFDEWIQGKRETGELADFFKIAGDRAKELWNLFVNLVGAAYDLGKAWAPVGGTVLDIVSGLADFVSWLSQLNPQLVTFLGYAILAYAAFTNIGKAVSALGSSAKLAIAGWEKLLKILLPAGMEARLGLTAAATDTLGASAERSGKRAEGAASSSSRFISSVGKWAGVIGIAAIAAGELSNVWDHFTVKTEDSVESIVNQGASIDDVKAKMDATNDSFRKWMLLPGGVPGFKPLIAGSESVNAELNKVYQTSGKVEQAQIKVALAQDAHTQAMKNFGSESGAAKANAKVLDDAITDLGTAQKNAGQETKTHVDRLKDLRTEIMSQIDSNFAFMDAQGRVKDAQAELNRVLGETPGDSKAVEQATRDLEKAQYDMVISAGQQAAAVNSGKDATVIAKAEAEAMAGQLIDLAHQAGNTLPPQLQILAASLDSNAWASKGARIETDQFGHSVLVLPRDMGTVPISAPGAAEARDRVRELDTALQDAKKSWFEFYTQAQKQPISIAVPKSGTASGVPGLIPGGTVVRATGGINILGMASGGVLPANIATIVKPNIPVMVGDNKRFNESYIPHDPTSTRAQQIFNATGAALGRQVLPQGAAEGTILGDVDATDYTKQLIELREKALQPLSDEVKTTTLPTLTNLNDLSGLTLTKTTLALQKTLDNSWKTNTLNTATASTSMQSSIQQLMNTSNASFANMQGAIGSQVGTITNQHLVFLRGGMGSTATAAENFSQAVAVSFDKMRGNTANPIHWMIDFPFNAGLVRAWNEVNGFFALNRPMKPLPQFATGGPIRGGAPDKDDVPLWAMTGEFIMPKKMVRDFGGIDNLERARLSSLGGSFRGTEGMGAGLLPKKMAVGGAVDRAMNYGKAQVGKPYVWGAVGPGGFDCSGLWSAMQNTLMGRSPNSRLYTTSDFNASHGAAGLLPGLKSAFTVGVQTGHMGGTLAGTAFEATPPRVRMSPSARGSSNFPMKFFLPEAGGQFIDAPGGQAFDVGAFVREKMAPAIGMSNDMRKFFGDALPVQGGQKAMLDMIQSITDWTTANVSSGVGTAGVSGDTIAQVKAVAARYGWDKGPEWDAISEIVNAESGWNPNAKNPNSSASGLFQKMTSIHGPVEATAGGQAEWGLKYIRDRYGDPISALAFRRSHGWYGEGGEVTKSFDNGGRLGPNQTGRNATNSDEWIFTDNQLRTVIRSSARSGAEQVPASQTSSNSSDNSTVVNLHMSPGTPWQDAIKEARHIWTHANRGVHGRT